MATVEERLSALESAVEDVKHRLAAKGKSQTWLEQVAGSLENWSEFDEVLRLGNEFRRSVTDTENDPMEGN
jgi:hypothetical protein